MAPFPLFRLRRRLARPFIVELIAIPEDVSFAFEAPPVPANLGEVPQPKTSAELSKLRGNPKLLPAQLSDFSSGENSKKKKQGRGKKVRVAKERKSTNALSKMEGAWSAHRRSGSTETMPEEAMNADGEDVLNLDGQDVIRLETQDSGRAQGMLEALLAVLTWRRHKAPWSPRGGMCGSKARHTDNRVVPQASPRNLTACWA